jgi:hypothetical protein
MNNTMNGSYPAGEGFRRVDWDEYVNKSDEFLHGLWGWVRVPDYLVGEKCPHAFLLRRRDAE